MATVSIVRSFVQSRSSFGSPIPVVEGSALSAESITSSGTSQQSSGVADANLEQVWVITVTGGNVWVKIGSNPTAAPGDQWLVLAGQTREFGASSGDKVAVIDA